uniref:AAA_28 domain-containing protein n=1 Tax=Globodera pallida TaxID=36090 RepID=A0A183BPY5_GLOPA
MGDKKQIFKIVLTGGPCAGKTTGQDLNRTQAAQFQIDLLKTLVFFNQAELSDSEKIMIILDRGAMDGSAYIDVQSWTDVLTSCKLDVHELRERYHQICHLVTAADGAPSFYQLANNQARTEAVDDAIVIDKKTREVCSFQSIKKIIELKAWVGHQCLSIVDNSNCRTFDEKMSKLIAVVCERLGIPIADRLAPNSKKRKWLVSKITDNESFLLVKREKFSLQHDYLNTTGSSQVRLRSRSQNGKCTYTLTTRTFEDPDGKKLPQPVETRKQLDKREYQRYMGMRDRSRQPIHKERVCFLYGNVYFNLDIYIPPLPPALRDCGKQLMILETYTTRASGDPEPCLPDFFAFEREITDESAYSMYNLARNDCKKTQ